MALLAILAVMCGPHHIMGSGLLLAPMAAIWALMKVHMALLCGMSGYFANKGLLLNGMKLEAQRILDFPLALAFTSLRPE